MTLSCTSFFTKLLLAGGGAMLVMTATSRAATIINADFNTGTFADAGLFDFNSQRTPTIRDSVGVDGTRGLDFENNGGSASASLTIGQVTTFSMFGQFNGNNNTSGGTMSFGWTKAAGEFNTYGGTGTGVVATDTVMVGLARNATGAFVLSAANGGLSSLTGTTAFSNELASLALNNWYRLEGTIQYDATTGTFTFLNISLDDFGEEGTTEVAANILFGATATVTSAGFGTTGRGLFATNRDRGITYTDNYVMTIVPEPASTVLLGIGGFALLLRRRRHAVHHSV